jgi:chaperonin GroES
MSKSSLQPLPGYLIVEPLKQSEKITDSGIYLAESHEEKPQSGKVIAVGSAIYNDGREVLCPVKVDDIVIYKEWGGKDFKDGETNLMILKFEDLMAVIK